MENFKMRVLITEENIDGCGSDAQCLVEFDNQLTQAQLDQLKQHLTDVKSKAARDNLCLDTDDMIRTAIGQLGESFYSIVAMADVFLKF